jgi:uncharacterized protein (TIGR02217 family)
MATPFVNVAFPDAVARGATGGPTFLTDVVVLGSGEEQRNICWEQAKCKFNIGTGIRTRAQMAAVVAHFRVVMGRAYSFPFKDWADYDAVDQLMEPVDATVYQLVKRYTLGGGQHVRTITKPKIGTVVVTVAGSVVTPAAIDHLTGTVAFASAPAATPTASFEFYVPVRFDMDHLPIQVESWDQQTVTQIDLVEVPE